MRILFITSSLPCGPGESFIITEIGELQRQGHQVVNIPMYPRGKVVHREAERINSTVVPLLSPAILAGALRTFLASPGRALKCLTWIFRSRNPVNLAKNLAVFPKALWLAGYIRRDNFDHIHVHWTATSATMGMIAGELSGLPWSFTAHRGDILPNNLLRLKLDKAVFGRCISLKSKAMVEALCGAPAEKLKVIHMGVALPALPAAARQPGRTGVVLSPANLIPIKGHRYLLSAARILVDRGVDFELWLAGDGKLRGELEEQVSREGLGSHVRFLGQISHETLLGYYEQRLVTATVLASVDLGNGEHEGIPVALIEAMAYGVPVVATATGGIPELLADGGGLLVPPQDPLSLAGAAEQLLTNRDARLRFAQGGRNFVAKEYNVEITVKQLTELMQPD